MDKYILECFYQNRAIRVYKNYAPVLRYGRNGLLVIYDKD